MHFSLNHKSVKLYSVNCIMVTVLMEAEYNNPINLSMYRELDGIQHLQASVLYLCVCVCACARARVCVRARARARARVCACVGV